MLTEEHSNQSAERPATLTCPPGLTPFCYDYAGNPCPLIVPRSALEHAKRIFKGMWVVPNLPLPVEGE